MCSLYIRLNPTMSTDSSPATNFLESTPIQIRPRIARSTSPTACPFSLPPLAHVVPASRCRGGEIPIPSTEGASGRSRLPPRGKDSVGLLNRIAFQSPRWISSPSAAGTRFQVLPPPRSLLRLTRLVGAIRRGGIGRLWSCRFRFVSLILVPALPRRWLLPLFSSRPPAVWACPRMAPSWRREPWRSAWVSVLACGCFYH